MNYLDFLTGRTTDQLVSFQGSKFLVHKEMNQALVGLLQRAAQEGIELAMTSSFRSYEDQKMIWNNKAQGKRVVLDSDSRAVDISALTSEELMFLILRWSAIPGGSRHHWGTDIDVYDLKSLPENYKIQLVPGEYQDGGIFSKLDLWLTENMADFGFYRPYAKDAGGIAPEPWHLSYRPLSEHFLQELSFSVFQQHLEQSDFLLMDVVKEHQAQIYKRFIQLP